MPGSPGGQEIGRVSVKVVPNTSKFGEKMRNQLRREARGSVEVEVQAKISKKSLDHVRQQLKHWRKDISPLKVEVKPELALGSTTLINARLNYAARARTVPILPYLVPGSMRAVSKQFGTMIAALSGGRVVKNLTTDFVDWAKNLDKTALKIGLVTQGIIGLGAAGLTSISNIFATGAALASISGVIATLPATFASMAIGVGVLIAAFKDFNTVLPGVKSQLSKLQDLISGNFWAKAKAPIQDLIGNLLPSFSKGLGLVATQFGGLFASLAHGLSGALPASLVGGMFAQLSDSIVIAQEAMKPLTQTIATFGQIGSAYLPKMATWFLDMTTQFNSFLQNAANDGSLTAWIDSGLTALHDLGQVLKNVGGILSGIAGAATAAGGSTLGMMADTLERVNQAVNGPAFQGVLIKTLTAAHQAFSNIASQAGPAFMKFMETLGTVLSNLLPTVGSTIGNLVANLSTALSNPAFVEGFQNMVKGLSDALAAIGPALTPLSSMLGTIGSALGQLLTGLGPILATLVTSLSGPLSTIIPTLQPIISVLTGAFAGALQTIAPILGMLGEEIARLVSGSVLPALLTVFQALMPVIQAIAPVIADVLYTALQAIAPIIPMVAKAFASIIPLVGQLIVAILPLATALLPAIAAIFGALIPVIVQVAQAVLPPLIAAVTALVTALVPVIGVVAQIITWLVGMLAPVITFIAGLLVGIVTSLINGFTNIFEGIMGIWEGFRTMFSGGWSNFLNGLLMILQGIWNLIIGVIEVALNVGILGIFKKGIALLKGAWSGLWGAIKGTAKLAWAWIKDAFAIFVNGLKTAPTKALSHIKTLFSDAWNAIKGAARLGFQAIKDAIADKLGSTVTLVKGLPGKCVSALGNIGGTLKNAGVKLIQGFIDGIGGMFRNVKGKLQDLTKKLTDWKGPESLDRVLLVNAGQLIIEGLIKGLESRYDGVRKSLNGLTSDIGGMVIDGPQIADLSGSYSGIAANLAGASSAAAGASPLPSISVQMESNSSPEDVADAILFAQKRFRYGSAYAW